MSAMQHLPWQDILACLIGVGALVHVALRWWPREQGDKAAACSSCSSGCGGKDTGKRPVCDDSGSAPMQRHGHRVIPVTPQTPKH
jgi:hypothetical protein